MKFFRSDSVRNNLNSKTCNVATYNNNKPDYIYVISIQQKKYEAKKIQEPV